MSETDIAIGEGIYRDRGCNVAPSCLNCPLPACKHDNKGLGHGWLGDVTYARDRVRRDSRVMRLHEQGVGRDEIAKLAGVHPHTVDTIIRRGGPRKRDLETLEKAQQEDARQRPPAGIKARKPWPQIRPGGTS